MILTEWQAHASCRTALCTLVPALLLDKRAILVPDFALCELLIFKKKKGGLESSVSEEFAVPAEEDLS